MSVTLGGGGTRPKVGKGVRPESKSIPLGMDREVQNGLKIGPLGAEILQNFLKFCKNGDQKNLVFEKILPKSKRTLENGDLRNLI